MASLYIEDEEIGERVTEYARRLGATKTETIRRALDALEPAIPAAPRRPDLLARLDAWRAAHPLPPPTGVKADKAFFDEMWDDPD